MRVTRLISVFPELRLIVSTMLRSIPSMGHILMMLGLLLYVYGSWASTSSASRTPSAGAPSAPRC